MTKPKTEPKTEPVPEAGVVMQNCNLYGPVNPTPEWAIPIARAIQANAEAITALCNKIGNADCLLRIEPRDQ